VVHAGNQRITNKEHSPRVAEFRQELRRKIAAHAPKAGAHATAIPGLTLYRRTAPSPCYPAMYEPSLNVFVQGRKRITLAGTTYLCDESTFVLSSINEKHHQSFIHADSSRKRMARSKLIRLRSLRPKAFYSARQRKRQQEPATASRSQSIEFL